MSDLRPICSKGRQERVLEAPQPDTESIIENTAPLSQPAINEAVINSTKEDCNELKPKREESGITVRSDEWAKVGEDTRSSDNVGLSSN